MKKDTTSEQKIPTEGFICEDCAVVGWPKTITRGSTLIELILWCFFLVPGVIYSMWRLTSRTKGCRKCGGKMIACNTPRGYELLVRYHSY